MCTINVIIILVSGDELITTKHVSKIWEMRMVTRIRSNKIMKYKITR